MKEAYEIKALGEMIAEEAKKDGLTLAEETAEKLGKAAYLGFKKWMKESAAKSETKIDDFIAQFYDNVDAIAIPKIEALDFDGDGK